MSPMPMMHACRAFEFSAEAVNRDYAGYAGPDLVVESISRGNEARWCPRAARCGVHAMHAYAVGVSLQKCPGTCRGVAWRAAALEASGTSLRPTPCGRYVQDATWVMTMFRGRGDGLSNNLQSALEMCRQAGAGNMIGGAG
jgi:hypothetical protein